MIKKDSKYYTKKLDFNLYSKISLKNAESIKGKNYIINPHKLGNSMIIYFRDSMDNLFNIMCAPTDKIKWIKENIIANKNIIDEIEILYNGEILEDEDSLKDYDVSNGSILDYLGSFNAGGCDEFYLSDDLLDPDYDYDFTSIKDSGNKFYRGGLEYKRPCGWKRYALKVNNKYEGDSWLGSTGKSNNDKEWAVSYHGTKQKFVEPICKEGLHPGTRNAYGVGVYCTPNIETAEEYADIFEGTDGKKYKVVFQNRVKPSAIKKASDKGGPSDYWYIEKSEDIRPYSICVKKC